MVLCPAAQSNGLGIATPAVDPHTVTRAKLTNAELATAILQSGRRLVLYCLLETWLLDPDPRAWARWCRDPGRFHVAIWEVFCRPNTLQINPARLKQV